MQQGRKVVGSFPLSWKQRFETVVIIPSKTRDCKKCSEILCKGCKLEKIIIHHPKK